jgi:hypothetical protein
MSTERRTNGAAGRLATLRLSPTVSRAEQAVQRGADRVRSLAPGPALVRGSVLVFGVLALILAMTGPMRANGWSYLVTVALALVAAVRPDGPWVTATELIVAGVWLLGGLVYHEQRGLLGTLLLAALLYLHHGTAALAATLPVRGQLAPSVLLGWLARTGGVLLVTVAFALAASVLLPPSGTGHNSILLPVIGLLAALGAAVGVAYLLHRRRR